ncbi:uncharacterized protein LOC107370921 [Tetranychus urticae]|uniref:Large ribosomal subunit protein mL54 n=1 Tax=Tetranychus urticae TaxID=32264 RepID=T1JUI2_TETUR|nr:uncharacterized protein LOC107370921 [Tetranychus urticae]
MAALKSLFLSSNRCINHISIRLLATQKTSIGKKRFRLPVEQDAERLVNYVCGSNIYQEGEDIKLKDDSEYPDWIWKMKIHSFPKFDDYDPKSKEYWELCEIEHLFRTFRLLSNRPKTSKPTGKIEKDYEERILRARQRAILPEAIDHGYDPKDILEEPVNERIHLRPEESDTVVPYDQFESSMIYEKNFLHKLRTKSSNIKRPFMEIYATRVRFRKPKFI